jgi:hypothetical protein
LVGKGRELVVVHRIPRADLQDAQQHKAATDPPEPSIPHLSPAQPFPVAFLQKRTPGFRGTPGGVGREEGEEIGERGSKAPRQ